MLSVNVKTCFGCPHADKCELSPVTGEFTVRDKDGDTPCVAYSLRNQEETCAK